MEEKLLEELIPIESLEIQKESVIAELEKKGFDISDFENGSPFGTTLMVFFQIKNDLLAMARTIYKGMFVKSAARTWLDVKSEDYSKKRKQATKAEGLLTITRDHAEDPLIVPKGYVFKTLPSVAGNEYRFVSTEKTIIPAGKVIGYLSIEAEEKGAIYNVPLHSIKRSLVHIQGVESFDNEEGWLLKEGADREEDEGLRRRTLNSWAELSTLPIALKYKNVAEGVEGVLYVLVDDMHPRGQGTVDIIVASYAGTAGEKLLKEVEEACETIRGVYDDVLVKSAETVSTDIEMILYLPKYISEEGLQERAIEYIRDYFKIDKSRQLHTLYLSELIFHVRKNMEELEGIKIVQPSKDLALERNKVIILGTIDVKLERVW